MNSKRKDYTSLTCFFDYNHILIRDFVNQQTLGKATPREKVVQLFYAIRDGWRYNPYNITTRKVDYLASEIFQRSEGHCIDKSILMIACCRAIGVPARLCLAKVRNHIAIDKMVERFGSDVLVPHGYVEVYLDGKWIKITPVFNQSLCERLGVATLEFDGVNDAVFQAFDTEGKLFMEYLEDYGSFEDVPLAKMLSLLQEHYPDSFETFVKNTH